jgi:membrane protease YdiL (CAAX protease family)
MEDTQPTEYSHDEVFLTAVAFETALAMVAILLGWTLGPSARELVPELSAVDWWPVASGLLYGCLAAIPMLVVIELIRRIPWEPIQQLERLADDGMFKVLLELRPSELIVISICAGVGEELLFRGWLMYWVMQGADVAIPTEVVLVVALLVSSVIFGLFHPITPLYVVLATLMGLYFGALVLVTGNLLVPIAAHATYDAVQLIMSARSERAAETSGSA